MLHPGQLERDQVVRGVVPDGVVTIIAAQAMGTVAWRVAYRDERTGAVAEKLLYADDAAQLELIDRPREWTYDGDGGAFRLAMEAERIHLAHLFDPQLGLAAANVEPLPHQIAAVYDVMLPRSPLRFLLADDPGAGKTVMAGLLIKELILRGDVQRCLIVVPAALDQQWQEELRDKFDLHFDVLTRSQIVGAVGNPFTDLELVIGRIDLLKQDDNLERLRLADDWDLVVVDEAHKMSASFVASSSEVRTTARYRLGQVLSERTRHMLLLTATPHRGRPDDFRLFLALLDRDRFEGRTGERVPPEDVQDIMRRMMKEDLVGFDNQPLFPERFSNTLAYTLSPLEADLYEAVTRYVRTEMNRADRAALGRGGEGIQRRVVVGFALTTLQRRLASSPAAIHRSIQRRQQRLQRTLDDELGGRRASAPAQQLRLGFPELLGDVRRLKLDDYDELETDLEEKPEDEIEEIVDRASAARTVEELRAEIQILGELERQAAQLRRSEHDSKWLQLRELLASDEHIFDEQGRRHKLVVFTEHRDTLDYLVVRIGELLEDPTAVTVIHGGMGREERRTAQAAFDEDDRVQVLVATDAAGEGINLHRRAHLMVNYDLPWNPNRLEQRFGRIHRFGQQEDCHNWNLVASGTREGEVYLVLLEKLEQARLELGGKVFDVVGQLFTDRPLRELLIEAIRAEHDPSSRPSAVRDIELASDLEHYRELVAGDAFALPGIDDTRLLELREERERAEIHRLAPHFIASFFVEALTLLGGGIVAREPGLYQITLVPAELRNRARQERKRPLADRYLRVCFDPAYRSVTEAADIELIAPGHPLLNTVVDVVRERFGAILRQGCVLIDPDAGVDAPRMLFTIRSDLGVEQGGRAHGDGLVSSELHVVEFEASGSPRAGYVPTWLDYEPLSTDQRTEDLAARFWEQTGLAQLDAQHAVTYAAEQIVPRHYQRVKPQRDAYLARIRQAVDERLMAESLYWSDEAERLRPGVQAGRQPQVNLDRALQRFENLRQRRRTRLQELEHEMALTRRLPLVVASALVLPRAWLAAQQGDEAAVERARETRRIELLAMRAVLERELAAGYEVRDVSAENLGYDIEVVHPVTRELRLIEVKGRDLRGDTIALTRNEQIIARNKRAAYELAIVLIDGDAVQALHVIPDPLGPEAADGIPFALATSIFEIDRLLAQVTDGSVSA